MRLILVSGKGKPNNIQDKNDDNSTEFTSQLVKLFLRQAYCTVDIICIHSNTNLFRYDENIIFVKQELLPAMHRLRSEVVQKYKDKWRENMHVILSFADGSSARISAINQSLKHFQ